jgi:glycerol-3-phosphate dehydrogenase (NAD(P)+)
MSSNKKYIGVIGAGSFGTAIANVIAENYDVLLFARRQEIVDEIIRTRTNQGQAVHERVHPTGSAIEVTDSCRLIFPMVPSAFFYDVLQRFSPLLTPEHILIHGIKGFYIDLPDGETLDTVKTLSQKNVLTISELILRTTNVVRVGCVSGPNLAVELAQKQPAGTVVASNFDEVIQVGQEALRSLRFQVFGSHDMRGVELAGIMKNVIAIASGALSGLGLGENARALLIAKGLGELVRIGQALGASPQAFLGLAGIGDIVATAFSKHSRNYTVGYRLAKGETLQHIIDTSDEVAEGIQTVKVIKMLADHYRVRAPITNVLYRVLFENMPATKALEYLMKYPFLQDVDFI